MVKRLAGVLCAQSDIIKNMTELRCRTCNKLLMKIQFGRGEIVCKRCKKIVRFNVTTQSLEKYLERLKDRSEEILDKTENNK